MCVGEEGVLSVIEMWVLKDEEVDNDVVDMCGDDKENLQKDHDVGKDDDKNKDRDDDKDKDKGDNQEPATYSTLVDTGPVWQFRCTRPPTTKLTGAAIQKSLKIPNPFLLQAECRVINRACQV